MHVHHAAIPLVPHPGGQAALAQAVHQRRNVGLGNAEPCRNLSDGQVAFLQHNQNLQMGKGHPMFPNQLVHPQEPLGKQRQRFYKALRHAAYKIRIVRPSFAHVHSSQFFMKACRCMLLFSYLII